MNYIYENDFLDELRFLNKDNINEDINKRNILFDKLMVIASDAPDYLSHLSSAYAAGFDKQFKDNIAKEYILSNIFCTQIQNQLQDSIIEDRISELYIDKNSGAYSVSYIGSIKGMKTLVESFGEHFNSLKKSLLIGLITRYSMEIQNNNNKNIDRLNKLVVIYLEHIMNIKLSNDIPMVIDEEFIKEIVSNKDNINVSNVRASIIAVHNLIDRKYNHNKKDYLNYDCYGYRIK